MVVDGVDGIDGGGVCGGVAVAVVMVVAVVVVVLVGGCHRCCPSPPESAIPFECHHALQQNESQG